MTINGDWSELILFPIPLMAHNASSPISVFWKAVEKPAVAYLLCFSGAIMGRGQIMHLRSDSPPLPFVRAPHCFKVRVSPSPIISSLIQNICSQSDLLFCNCECHFGGEDIIRKELFCNETLQFRGQKNITSAFVFRDSVKSAAASSLNQWCKLPQSSIFLRNFFLISLSLRIINHSVLGNCVFFIMRSL